MRRATPRMRAAAAMMTARLSARTPLQPWRIASHSQVYLCPSHAAGQLIASCISDLEEYIRLCKSFAMSTHAGVTFAADTGSRRLSQRGRRRKAHASAAAHLPSVPIEAAVNMCLARVAFDLLRSAAFKQRMHAHIQRKLDVLRIPEYIQSIEVATLLVASAPAPPAHCSRCLSSVDLLRRRTLAIFAQEQLEQEELIRKCCR